MAASGGFSKKTTAFLRDLEKNNDRAWFNDNKSVYEEHVQQPMLDFIAAVAAPLRKISPHIVADDKKVGGSMMRIHRDTRFSKDKRPYNEHVSVRFLHERAKKTPAPGFYLRVAAREITLGTGIWHPDPEALGKIRDHIVDNASAWVRVRDGKRFAETFGALDGESLKRAPKGYDPDHPLVEDLKRKDFCAFTTQPASALVKSDFLAQTVSAYKTSAKFVAFLCDALDLEF